MLPVSRISEKISSGSLFLEAGAAKCGSCFTPKSRIYVGRWGDSVDPERKEVDLT
jgi:hypothetical protein